MSEFFLVVKFNECIDEIRGWSPDQLELPVWTTKNHKTHYSPGFQKAMFSLLLVCNRLRLCKDVRMLLVKALAQSERKEHGWPDSWPIEEMPVVDETKDGDDCVIQ